MLTGVQVVLLHFSITPIDVFSPYSFRRKINTITTYLLLQCFFLQLPGHLTSVCT